MKRISYFTLIAIMLACLTASAQDKKSNLAELTIVAAENSQSEGAMIRVNGKELGKLPLKVPLQPGRYIVEVYKDGFQQWSQWIDLKAREQREVPINLVRNESSYGTLLVAANILGAQVLINGQPVDTTPALIEKLVPGKYSLEIRAKGYQPEKLEAQAEAGKTNKVTVELKPEQQATPTTPTGGSLQVLADQKGVEIFVDGVAKGQAPVKIDGLSEGTHVIEGRANGMVSAEQMVTTRAGETQTVTISLQEPAPARPSGSLRVVTQVAGANVLLDGTVIGKTPHLQQQIDVGTHLISIRADGYQEFVQKVEIKSGEIAELQVVLIATGQNGDKKEEPTKKPRKQRSTSTWGLSSFGAHLVEPSNFTGDISVGFAHLIEGRLTAGIFSGDNIGIDGGVEFRTFFATSEIGLHAKLRFFDQNIFSAAALFDFGGGAGPSARNTFYSNLGLVASMWFKQLVTFSGRAYFNFYSDRNCPSTEQANESSICKTVPVDISAVDMRNRMGGVRLFISAILEVPISSRANVFGILEGIPFQGERRAYTDRFATIMPDDDSGIYGRIGFSFKY